MSIFTQNLYDQVEMNRESQELVSIFTQNLSCTVPMSGVPGSLLVELFSSVLLGFTPYARKFGLGICNPVCIRTSGASFIARIN